jgi:hypothetical protein
MYHMYIIGEYFSLEYIILERVQLSVVSNGRVQVCRRGAWSVEGETLQLFNPTLVSLASLFA